MGEKMSILTRLREFQRKQTNNFNVLLHRSVVASFLTQLVENFSNLYIVELGATPFQLSQIRSIGSAISALVSIPVGWLSDVYSTKRIIIFGMLVQVISVAFYAFAEDVSWVLIAMALTTLTMTLVFRIQHILFANSLSDRDRATGYAMRTLITQFFSLFAPTIGGILVYVYGGISVEGIRPLYIIQLIGFILLTVYIALRLEEKKVSSSFKTGELYGQYREMFKGRKHLTRFAFLQALGSLTWGMSLPFHFVYAAEFKNANSLTIGYMGTCYVLVSMISAMPLGSLADSRGRKFTVYITRPFFYASLLLLVLAPPDTSWILLLAWGMRGIMMGSSAWQTMSMEMVPKEYRGRWTGLISLVQNLIRVPAMLLGGYLYESVNPALVFIIPILVDGLIRIPLLRAIPDTAIPTGKILSTE
jgi:MFS family permease